MNPKKSFFTMLATAISLCAGTGDKNLEIFGWVSPYGAMPTEQQISHLTHLVCYPISPTADGTVRSEFSSQMLDSLVHMAHRNNVKVLFSLGSGGRDLGLDIQKDPSFRGKMVSSIMDVVNTYDLDGFDNAWEPPFHYQKEVDEGKKHAELLAMRAEWNGLNKALRDSLDQRFGTSKKMLSITLAGINSLWFKTAEFAMDNAIYPDNCWLGGDRVMLMTYSDGLGAKHATFDAMVAQTNKWIGQGMPKNVIIPGLPFNANGLWGAVEHKNGTIIPASFAYKKIVEDFPDLNPETDVVTYDFAGDSGTVTVSYGFNGISTIRKKLAWISDNEFPGSMFWQLGDDAPLSSSKSLLREISTVEPWVETIFLQSVLPTIELETATFEKKISLKDLFRATAGTVIYEVGKPNRHRVSISGDTLIINGDGKNDIGVTIIPINGRSSINNKDYKTTSLILTVSPKNEKPIPTSKTFSDLMRSEEWSVTGTAKPASSLFRRVNSTGDTTIQILGMMKPTKNWSDVSLTTTFTKPVPLFENNTEIVIRYKGFTTSPTMQSFVMLADKKNVMFVAPLENLDGKVVTQRLTKSHFRPGWEQPSTFDFTSVSSILLSHGLSAPTENVAFDFELYSLQIDGKSTSVIAQTVVQPAAVIRNNQLNLSLPVSVDHSLTISDLRGRVLWNSELSQGVSSLNLPQLGNGVYILQMRGKEYNLTSRFIAE